MYVYLTKLPNGMKYIGASTKDPKKSQGYFGSTPELVLDLNLFEKSLIKKTILNETDNVKDLEKLELEALKKYNAVKDSSFYNKTYTVHINRFGVKGYQRQPFSKATKKKMSLAQQGNTSARGRKKSEIEIIGDQIRKTGIGKGYSKTPEGNYQAHIRIDGKTIYLGRYRTVSEAHKVYREACNHRIKELEKRLKELKGEN